MVETAPGDIAGLVEEAAASMYGKNWSSPEPDKRPGEKMKDVWRGYARDALAPILPRLSALSEENKRLRADRDEWRERALYIHGYFNTRARATLKSTEPKDDRDA